MCCIRVVGITNVIQVCLSCLHFHLRSLPPFMHACPFDVGALICVLSLVVGNLRMRIVIDMRHLLSAVLYLSDEFGVVLIC